MERDFWLPATLLLCGVPGALAFLAGGLVAMLGLLANTRQLKLDTNLDRPKVLLAGLGLFVAGIILIAVPVVLFLR